MIQITLQLAIAILSTELILAIRHNYQQILIEVEMKKLFMRIIVLGILGGIGYVACKKLCNKDRCGSKKEA
jgi:hypothetical protein